MGRATLFAAALLLVLFVVAISAGGVRAELTLSNTLGSNMVLQRGVSSRIWGWATPGDVLTVSGVGAAQQATAGADGSWQVSLPVQAASATAATIVVSDTTSGESATLSNVLFGDVYVCSGQSNMQFTVPQAFNASEETQQALQYGDIRVMTVGQTNYSATPLAQLAGIEQQWVAASTPGAIGGGNWTEFSAVCWFFARSLYDEVQVPLGLVSSNWGGTYVQAWMTPEARALCPDGDSTFSGPNQPSVLYNAMIAPFTPMALTGAVWYQGEANQAANQSAQYACLFPAMIKDWRQQFAQNLDFYFVQLAAYTQGELGNTLPAIRLTQMAATTLPGVGYATAVDLGDVSSPFGNIHPRDKQTVGYRLATSALDVTYGTPTLLWTGPVLQSAQLIAGATQPVSFLLTFSGINGNVLQLLDPQCPTGISTSDCGQPWEVAYQPAAGGGAPQWLPALAQLSNDTSNQVVLFLQAAPPANAAATQVRYLYSNWPLAQLYDNSGFPALPFVFDVSN